MPNVHSDDDISLASERHYRKDGSINSTKLAAELNMPRTTVQRALARLARQGRLGTVPVLPGFGLKQTTAVFGRDGELQREFVKQTHLGEITEQVRDGFAISKVSTYRDAHGATIGEWTQQKPGERQPEEIAESIKKAFENYTPAAPMRPLQSQEYANCLTLYPLADMHIGMFSWGKETDTDWDLSIAERVITETMEKVSARTAPSKVGVVLVGGDATHSDTNENKTAKSGNVLQVDGRYDKIIEVTQKIVVRQIELALDKHETVEVRVLKGNHDYHTSVAVAAFLKAWYRFEPRVIVDTSPSLFWWRTFGVNFLASHHGHETKAKDMPMAMAVRRPVMWGETKHRYAHVFHFHNANKTLDTVGGVIVETHEAPCPQDDWHYGKSFLSGRSMKSITYDPQRGESSRVTENL